MTAKTIQIAQSPSAGNTSQTKWHYIKTKAFALCDESGHAFVFFGNGDIIVSRAKIQRDDPVKALRQSLINGNR